MKYLAVGIDFSEADVDLLAVAVLAKQLRAALHLVHVQREFAAWTECSMLGCRKDPSEWEKLSAENRNGLEAIAAKARDAGASVDLDVRDGRTRRRGY
jgi:hypothetical protein